MFDVPNENKKIDEGKILEVLSNEISNMHDETVSEELEEISKNLNIDQYARIPEIVFKEFFLPYFKKEKDIKEDELVIAKWIEIAGSPFMPVHIIDSDNNILYTVPPLFNNINLSTDLGDIASSFSAFKEREEVLPADANKILVEELSSIKAQVTPKDKTLLVNEWGKILHRYDEETNEDVVNNQEDNDDIIYD